jgi:hypothetical protein
MLPRRSEEKKCDLWQFLKLFNGFMASCLIAEIFSLMLKHPNLFELNHHVLSVRKKIPW